MGLGSSQFVTENEDAKVKILTYIASEQTVFQSIRFSKERANPHCIYTRQNTDNPTAINLINSLIFLIDPIFL